MGFPLALRRHAVMRTLALAVCLVTVVVDGAESDKADSSTASRHPVAVVAARSFAALVGGLRDAFNSNEKEEMRSVLDDMLEEIRDPTTGAPRGISARRPVGLMVFSGEGASSTESVTFVPVSNESQFLVLTDFFFPKRETVESGLYRMSGGSSTYLRMTPSWAYLSENPRLLRDTLPDPVTLLPQNAKTADFVFHLDVKSIPRAHIKAIREYLQENSLQSAVRMPGESEASFLRRMHNAELQTTFVQSFLADGYSLTVSALGGESGKAVVDLDLAATRGSGLDRMLDAWLGRRPSFGSLDQPGTIFSSSVALPLDDLLWKNVQAFLSNLHDRVRLGHQALMKSEPDKRDELSKSWRGITTLFKDIEARLKADGLDLLCRVGEEPSGTLGWLLASKLRDAGMLAGWFEANLPLLVETGVLQSWKSVEKRHRGYRIFGAWPQVGGGASVFDLFGSEPSFHVAVDSDTVVLSLGEHSLPALIRGIDNLHRTAPALSPPVRIDVSVRPAAMLLSELAPKSLWNVAMGHYVEGDAQFRVEVQRVDGGARARLTLDSGGLRNVGRWAIDYFGASLGQ